MNTIQYDRYYLSYSGIKLPLKLVSPLQATEVENRNTYFAACIDKEGRNTLIHKVVYGEIELAHRYGYDPSGKIQWAEITNIDREVQRFEFD